MNRNATFRHEVQFYIRNALKSHTAVIVLATKSHRESLVQRLSGEDFDIDFAMQHGMYISLDAVEMLSTIIVNGIPDRLRFFEGLCGLIESAGKASKTEHPRVAICGECVGVLCAEGNVKAAIQLEEVGNDLAQSYDVEIMCAYPLSSFHEESTEAYKHICAQHTTAYSI